MYLPCVGTKHIKANGKQVYSILLSTWNSEYALQLQSMIDNDMLSVCETTHVFIDAFCYSKIHFHQLGPFKLIKTMVKSLHVLLGLSPVWNLCPKGSHKKGTTFCRA